MATKITQLGDSGTPGRRFGSFSGKPAASGRTVGKILQLQLSGTPGRRFGSFAARGSGGGGTAGAFYIFGDAVIS